VPSRITFSEKDDKLMFIGLNNVLSEQINVVKDNFSLLLLFLLYTSHVQVL
jgi:hypothetical protein